MKIAVVEKLKLNGVTPEIDAEFRRLTSTFAQACDEISSYAFERGATLRIGLLNEELYRGVRESFGLKAQLTQSAIRAVVARYAAVGTRLREETVSYAAEDGKTYGFHKSLDWLRKPIRFLAPQAEFVLVRGRGFSFLEDGSVVSVAAMSGRVRLSYSMRRDSRLFDPEWRIGGARLLKKGGKWFLHVSLTKDVPDVENSDAGKVVGVDLGLVNIAAAYDGETAELYSGDEAGRLRDRFERTRASLQKKGTKGAKRVLRRIAGRENRWMNDLNHRLSKALVSEGGQGTLFALEDLSGASLDERNLASRTASGRRELRSWAFYDLRMKLEYKAALAGSRVEVFDPAFTSQRCPSCGNVDKSARDRSKHRYACPKCGAEFNDDAAAAMNLRELGLRLLKGEKNPNFRKKAG